MVFFKNWKNNITKQKQLEIGKLELIKIWNCFII